MRKQQSFLDRLPITFLHTMRSVINGGGDAVLMLTASAAVSVGTMALCATTALVALPPLVFVISVATGLSTFYFAGAACKAAHSAFTRAINRKDPGADMRDQIARTFAEVKGTLSAIFRKADMRHVADTPAAKKLDIGPSRHPVI